MKRLSDIRREVSEKVAPIEQGPRVYRCAANGCPNAGCIDDDADKGIQGKCFWHWREPDPKKWPALTRWTQDNWSKARNY